jgi:hypothetical protein
MDFMGVYFLKRLMSDYAHLQAIISCALQPDSFYFNILPFAEDVREFQFRSFSKLPSSSQPTEQQQEVADNLVKMLDLAPPGREEILRPDFTPNPMLEVKYCSLPKKLFFICYFLVYAIGGHLVYVLLVALCLINA